MVWRLLHSIASGSSSSMDSAFRRRDRYIDSFAVCDSANSSALVEDVVTVSYLFAL